MEQGENYKLAYLRSKKELFFCLQEMPNLPPFSYTFQFQFFDEVALWAQVGPQEQCTLTLTLQSPSQIKFLLDNQLLLALLILSSKLTIKRKQDLLKQQIQHIFKAMGLKLKWLRQHDLLTCQLQKLLVTNTDFLSLQQLYGKSEINIETVSTVKQFNAYNHIKELAIQMLDVVLSEKNPTQKYDEMVEDLKLRYLQMSALHRIRTVNKKWSFQRLEQEVHARLVESLRRPVLTVESERENTEPNHDICDLFQIRFAEIDEKVAHTDFQVSEFKEAINGFVKDVATDLRSQENLIILMEFLLAKTFGFFEMKEVLALANASQEADNQRRVTEISIQNLIEKESDTFLRDKVIDLKRRYRQMQSKYRSKVESLQEKVWQLEKNMMNEGVRTKQLIAEREEQLRKATQRIKNLQQKVNSLNKSTEQKQQEHSKLVKDLSGQLQKLKIQSSFVTPDDRQALTTSTKSATVNRSPPAYKANFTNTLKRPYQNRQTASMKQLPGSQTTIDIKQIVPSTVPDSKPKTFIKKDPTVQPQFRSPKANQLLKKGQPKKSNESATLINNINAVVSYVKEQAKNISQRPVPVKGKQNVTGTVCKK